MSEYIEACVAEESLVDEEGEWRVLSRAGRPGLMLARICGVRIEQ